jgi:hypothetical protein
MHHVHCSILDSVNSLHRSLSVLFQVQDILGMTTKRKRALDELILGTDSDAHISEERILPHISDNDKEETGGGGETDRQTIFS